MNLDQLTAYAQLAETIRERFGDNWKIVFDPEYDVEASVRTEDSTPTDFIELFSTSQTNGDDPLDLAGFLATAVENVPALMAEVKQLTGQLESARITGHRLVDEVNQLNKQIRVAGIVGRAETDRAAYDAMDAERRSWESRRSVDNVANAELRRERDQARDARAKLEELRERYRAGEDIVDGDLRAADLDAILDAWPAGGERARPGAGNTP